MATETEKLFSQSTYIFKVPLTTVTGQYNGIRALMWQTATTGQILYSTDGASKAFGQAEISLNAGNLLIGSAGGAQCSRPDMRVVSHNGS